MPEAKFANDHAFMPANRWLSDAQWLKVIGVLSDLGMRKLRITGGEPLLRKNLVALITQIKSQWPGVEIALTTNASQLAAHARSLKAAGLDRLTISFDSLDASTFARMSGGRGDVAAVLEGIEAARTAGFETIKLNCVVQKDVNDSEVIDLVRYFKTPPFVLRFIEYMDVGTQNAWQANQVVSNQDLIALIHRHHALEPVPSESQGEVAERFRYADGSGEIGFISSISKPFCRGCTRARISADGKLYTCLFSANGHDLRGAIDSADSMLLGNLIRGIWRARDDRYSELRALKQSDNTAKAEMYHLGG